MTVYAFTNTFPWLASRGIIDLDAPLRWYADSSGTLHADRSRHAYAGINETPTATLSIREVAELRPSLKFEGQHICPELYCVGAGAGVTDDVLHLGAVLESDLTIARKSLERLDRSPLSPAACLLGRMHFHQQWARRLGHCRDSVTSDLDVTLSKGVRDALSELEEMVERCNVTIDDARHAASWTALADYVGKIASDRDRLPAAHTHLQQFKVTTHTSRFGAPDAAQWFVGRCREHVLAGLSPLDAMNAVRSDASHEEFASWPGREDDHTPSREEVDALLAELGDHFRARLEELLADTAPWVLPVWRADDEGRASTLETFCHRANIYRPSYWDVVVGPGYLVRFLYDSLDSGRRASAPVPAPNNLDVGILDTAFSLMESEGRDSELGTFPGALAAAAKL